MSTAALVSTALSGDTPLGVGAGIPNQAQGSQIFTADLVTPIDGAHLWNQYEGTDGLIHYWNPGPAATFEYDSQGGFLWLTAPVGNPGAIVQGATELLTVSPAGAARLPLGTLTVARDPATPMEVATANWVSNNTVRSFNQRIGQVQLNAQDVYAALQLCDLIATQPWTQSAINAAIQNLLYTCNFVNTWNGRKGQVYLMLSDITCVFYQPGQQPISPTPPPTSSDDSIATTKWITQLYAPAPTQSTPPLNPTSGQLWWNDVDGNLYVYYQDATSAQWVSAFADAGGTGAFLPLTGGVIGGNLTVEYPGTVNKLISAPTHPSAAYIGGSTQFGSYYTPAAAGGTAGQVSANGTFYSSITGAPNENIWCLIAVADYSGPGGNGQHVAFDTQAIRRTVNAGGAANNPELWSYNCQVLDYTNTDSAETNSLSAIEIGYNCGNTDSANNRRIIGIYLDRANVTDVSPTCALGLQIAANHGSFNWITRFDAPFNTAAIDTRGSTQNAGAHAIWLGDNMHVAWDSAGANTSYWDPAIFSGSGGLHQHANVQVDGTLFTPGGFVAGGTATLTTVGVSGRIVSTAVGSGGTSAILVTAALPSYAWEDPTQGADGKIWDAVVVGGSMNCRAVNDAGSAATTWLSVSRAGDVPQIITLTAPHIVFGSGLINAANDAAAAAAGVAVDGLYRNGSVVQIRVT